MEAQKVGSTWEGDVAEGEGEGDGGRVQSRHLLRPCADRALLHPRRCARRKLHARPRLLVAACPIQAVPLAMAH